MNWGFVLKILSGDSHQTRFCNREIKKGPFEMVNEGLFVKRVTGTSQSVILRSVYRGKGDVTQTEGISM